ncbi:hypothetical protein [Metallibacterium sp.]
MTSSANYKQVLAHFNNKSQEIIEYFPEFPKLVVGYSWDVSVSYVFSRIEMAKHMTIYCGIVKLHWANSALTKELIDKDHMSRGRFRELFKTVYGDSMDAALLDKLSRAEVIRDKVVHGKSWSDEQARTALIDVFDFAEGLNKLTHKIAGFKIFGDLRGFKGRKESLSRETTRWVLRGMGIPAKELI